jgi:hypothetical protein
MAWCSVKAQGQLAMCHYYSIHVGTISISWKLNAQKAQGSKTKNKLKGSRTMQEMLLEDQLLATCALT